MVGGILGLGSAAIDLFQGFIKRKEGNAKGAQDEFVTAGTKTGMVGAGAAAGAAIGSAFFGVGAVPGALIGAGIGGLGALLGGDGLGKMLSDALDEGGLLNNASKAIGGFFIETLPAWAEGVGQRAAVFFGETVPTFVGNLFTNVGAFFTETIPEWATGAFEAAATFFTENVPQFVNDLWDKPGEQYPGNR